MTMTNALPFEVTRGFTAVPKAVLYEYFAHPDFKLTTLAVYLLLIDYYNENAGGEGIGYAFPTHDQIAQKLLLSRRSVRNAIGTLKTLGLINVHRNPIGNNDVYTFNRPIESPTLFDEKFPQAIEHRKKRLEAIARESDSRQKRQAEFLAEVKSVQARSKN